MLLVRNKMHLVEDVEQQLSCKFDKKDLKAGHFILGMEIKRNQVDKNLWLS